MPGKDGGGRTFQEKGTVCAKVGVIWASECTLVIWNHCSVNHRWIREGGGITFRKAGMGSYKSFSTKPCKDL